LSGEVEGSVAFVASVAAETIDARLRKALADQDASY
jgi:hypothetical protein